MRISSFPHTFRGLSRPKTLNLLPTMLPVRSGFDSGLPDSGLLRQVAVSRAKLRKKSIGAGGYWRNWKCP